MQLMPPFFRGENPIGKFLEILQEKQEEELTEKIISILESKGYKVTPHQGKSKTNTPLIGHGTCTKRRSAASLSWKRSGTP